MSIAAKVLAWHFTAEPGVLRNGEHFSLGKPMRVKGAIAPCIRGLHGSPSVLDALLYAPGPHLYRVELHGTIVPHGDPVDKYAASMRTATEYRDATPLLRVFARQCAADVLHLWSPPQIVRDYILTGDESIRAAARAAAGASSVAAAWAAWDAASAAWDAARDAARDAQRERLETWTVAFMKDGTVPEVKIP